MKNSFNNLLYVLFFFALTVITGLGIIARQNSSNLANTAEQIELTNKILAETRLIDPLDDESEIDMRDYLSTGNAALLEQYITDKETIIKDLAAFKTLVKDNPLQYSNVDSLQSAFTDKFKIYDSAVTLQRQRKNQAAINILASADGLASTARTDHLIFSIESFQHNYLEQQKKIGAKTLAGLDRAFWFLLFILIFLLGTLLLVISYTFGVKRKKEDEINRLNSTLEQRVMQRTDELRASEKRLRTTLENMIEGVQILDYNWIFLYVNDSLVKHSRLPRHELLGNSILDKYPGLENTEVFKAMKNCMENRMPVRMENEFIYADGSSAFFDLSIQPVPEGISILTVDITEQKKAREKILKANRLYAFISAINQSIVHLGNEQQLFDKACSVATEVGRFKMAWIGLLDQESKLNMISVRGAGVSTERKIQKYRGMDFGSPALSVTPIAQVLLTGSYFVSHNVQHDHAMSPLIEDLLRHGIKSNIIMPVTKFGKVVGIFSFNSTIENFFDTEEIALLLEAASDISFALEIFEKEKMRLQAEALVAENEARLKRAQSIAHIGHWELDFATGVAEWSEESCRIYGLDPKDTRQSFDSWASYIHPGDVDFVMGKIKEAGLTFSDNSFNHRILRKDGSIRHIHSESKFQFDSNGKPRGLYGISHDITEQKLSEEAVRRSEANLTAIIENTDANIYSLDNECRYLTFNSALRNNLKLAYGLDIKPGDKIFDFLKKLDPAEAEDWEKIYSEALSGKSMRFVKEFNVGGHHIFSSLSINPIRANGLVIGLSCMAQDITQQKLAEAEIISLNASLERKVKERTEELERANRELESFSYTVSHDLQSPVRSLRSFSKILQKNYSEVLGKDGKELLDIIENSAKGMGDLIHDLLGFSRLGKTALSKTKTNMNDLVKAITEGVKLENQYPKAEINLHDLKSTYCDPALIKQVWANLISNAVKYSSKKEKPVIEIGMTHIQNNDVYYVKDNGAGFDMKYADKLFDVFQRGHSSRDFEGTGVGLATAQRIVTKHNGKIWAEAKENEGATFYFTLQSNN